jgi:DNA-binding transcriptional LysR family regulator
MTDLDSRAFKRFCEEVLPKLATFQTACDCETRRNAGKVLGIGGPAVGKAIAALEEALKGPLNNEALIDHSGPQHVIPTEAGDLLKSFVEDIRSRSVGFLSKLEAMQHGSNVKLAMTRSAWLAYAAELEAAYRKVRPEGTVDCGNEFYSRDRVWNDIEASLLAGHVDVGVYSFPPSRRKKHVTGGIPKGIALRPLVEEEIVLVLPGKRRDLPKGKQLSLRQLPSVERVVHYRRSLEFDRTTTIEAYLGEHGLLGRYADDWLLGVDTISEIKDTLIRLEEGMSFLPWPDVEHEHRGGTLRAYRLDPPMRPRTIWLAYRPRTSKPAVKDFLKATESLPKKREFVVPEETGNRAASFSKRSDTAKA